MYHLNVTIHDNPDRDQGDWQEDHTISASSVAELRRKVLAFQGDNDIGGGNWGRAAVEHDGTLVGFMSYNGRLWKTPYSGIGAQEIL